MVVLKEQGEEIEMTIVNNIIINNPGPQTGDDALLGLFLGLLAISTGGIISAGIILAKMKKIKKEEEIVAKEKEAQELKRKYFGPEGELYKKRESLMAPIQDEIYTAVKEISDTKGYTVVVDRASAASIIYASPKIDISNEVLVKLGYAN